MIQVYVNLTENLDGINSSFSFNDKSNKSSYSFFIVQWNTTIVPQSCITELSSTSFQLDFIPSENDTLEVWYFTNQSTPDITAPTPAISDKIGLTIFEIKNVIWDWVNSHSIDNTVAPSISSNVIWSDQNAPQPQPPFITLKIINETDIGLTGEKYYVDETFNYLQTKSITLSINMYGGNAQQVLSTLENSLMLPEVREYFRNSLIIQYDCSEVTNIATLMDTVYESRSNLDVMFYVQNAISSTSTNIDSVAIEKIGGDSDIVINS